ncbi:DUF4440 domain-containing protein [Cedecea sp.]|jgi:hypothetical protein|uniref:nuclear transport factor 2 family protein n=1 Tax=Cedecea sp. TaxID=1970739 RepID=UPI002F3FBC11
MMRDELPHLLAQLVEDERRLHLAGTRSKRDIVAGLLHGDFFEIGRSGRRYERQHVIESLAEEMGAQQIHADGFSLSLIDSNSALLTYRSWQFNDNGGMERLTLRASLWVKTESESVWRLRFHQGTPAPDS